MNVNNQDIISLLDLEAAQIIAIKSSNNILLILGAIFLITILCYYFSIASRQKQIIKILKIAEIKSDSQNLLLAYSKFKDWLSICDKRFLFLTELEIAQFLRANNMHALANFVEISNNIKYQSGTYQAGFSYIFVPDVINEIKNIKNAKTVFKIKL
jgi:hypothetical protein